MSCPTKVNSNTIELKVHTSGYCIWDLLCVSMSNTDFTVQLKIDCNWCIVIYFVLYNPKENVLLDIMKIHSVWLNQPYNEKKRRGYWICVELTHCFPSVFFLKKIIPEYKTIHKRYSDKVVQQMCLTIDCSASIQWLKQAEEDIIYL